MPPLAVPKAVGSGPALPLDVAGASRTGADTEARAAGERPPTPEPASPIRRAHQLRGVGTGQSVADGGRTCHLLVRRLRFRPGRAGAAGWRRRSPEACPEPRKSFSSFRERGVSGRAPCPQSWRWPCATQAKRWGSWTWTCAAPAFPACCARRAGPCTSVTVAGCQSLPTPSKTCRSCPWDSCWSSPMRPWCGAAPRRMVTWAAGARQGARPAARATLILSRGLPALIKQFVRDVAWGPLDFLLVDTPPGTSDEHMAAVEALRPYSPLSALVITTPQAVSVGDVRRELTFCRKTGLRVLGVVENMSGFVCPHCSECTNVFSQGGGEELAGLAGVPFLGAVPLDPQLSRSLEEGGDFLQDFPDSPAFPALSSIARQILDRMPIVCS